MIARVLAVAWIASACTKPAPAHPREPLVRPTSGPIAAPKRPHVAIDWDKDLGFLPVDSELVLGVDLAQVRKTALWAQYAPQVLAKAQPVLARMQAVCGLDLVAELDGFAVGVADVSTAPRGAAILHGLSRAQVKTCVDRHDPAITVTTDGELTLLTTPSGPLATTFLDDTTLLIVSGAAATKDGITNLMTQTVTIPASVAFIEMWRLIDKHASAWFLVNANSSVVATLKTVTPDALAIFGSIRITDNLALDGRIRTGAASSATMLVALIKPQLSPQTAAMFSTIDVTADGNDAHLVFEMTPDEIDQMAELFSPPVRRDPKGR